MSELWSPYGNPAFITPDFSSSFTETEAPLIGNVRMFQTTRVLPAPSEEKDISIPSSWAPEKGLDGATTRPRGATMEQDYLRHETPLSAWLPAPPVWLNQIHGATVIDADAQSLKTLRENPPNADAIISRSGKRVLAIQTADCLPVVFFDMGSHTLGAAHAGWRGLAAGVLEATLAAMKIPPDRLCAWIAPAIQKAAFLVGSDVYRAFHAEKDSDVRACFERVHTPEKSGSVSEEKWLADLPRLARLKLNRAGVSRVMVSDLCTYANPDRFFSYRRKKEDGRMVTFVYRV